LGGFFVHGGEILKSAKLPALIIDAPEPAWRYNGHLVSFGPAQLACWGSLVDGYMLWISPKFRLKI
jgi:hypothetical protein